MSGSFLAAIHARSRCLTKAAVGVLLSIAAGTGGLASAAPPVPGQATPGVVTYIDFWASWCTPCAQAFPWLNQLQQRYEAQGLRVIGVGVDTEDANAQRFLKAHPAGFEIVRDPDGKLAEQYAVEGMPYGVIVDANGRIVHRHSGFRAGDVDAYEQAIKSALAGNGVGK